MAIWWDKKRKVYRYEFEIQGNRLSGSAKTKTECKKKEAVHREEVAKSGQSKTRTDTAFSTIANLYLDWSAKRHVKKTYEYKAMVFREFRKFHGDIDIREITPQKLHEYLNSRPSNHNYNVHRKELSALFAFAVKSLKILDHSPCWDLEKLPEEAKKKIIPTQEEFLRILAAAGPDERPLLVILTHTLARIDEILRLRWEDVNFEKRIVTLWTRKRRGGNMEPRDIPMNEDLHSVLWPMWSRRIQNDFVFWNKKESARYNRRPKLMPSLCRRAGLTRQYGFHEIRHFVATYLHDICKIPTGVIGTLLGHKSKRTTEIYLHSVDSAAVEAVSHLEGAFQMDSKTKPRTQTPHKFPPFPCRKTCPSRHSSSGL